MLTLLVGAVFLVAAVSAQPEVTPILNTPNGPIYGAKRTYNGQFYEEYLGVPFAAPPVGELRWEKPRSVTPWTEPLNATAYSQHCTQFIAVFYQFIGYGGQSGEDCLYANVWVPGGVQDNIGRQRPVLLFIYGGAFIFGMGEMYEGYALALHGDTIVVNFNYRVSSLGFLSTGDPELPGNYGLWDQNAAFKWVQENIASFGGDPTRVTIFGQSAGAASVSHAVASPHNVGLFQNAIAISGGATSFFALANRPLETAMAVGDLFDCGAHNTQQLVACLREQEALALDFYSVVLSMLETKRIMNILPVVDGDYVPVHPRQLYEQGAGKDVNFFTGSTYHDFYGFVVLNPVAAPGLGDRINFARTNESLWTFAKFVLGGAENVEELFASVVQMYPDLYSEDEDTRTRAMTRAFTDYIFGSSTNWEARQHSVSGGSGKTYQYQFKYRQSFLVGYLDWVEGSHLDDVYSVLGEPFFRVFREKVLKHNFSSTDLEVSNTIMDYYTNIAYTSNPNTGPFSVPVEWTEFSSVEQNFLRQSSQFSTDSFYTDNWVDKFRYWTDDFYNAIRYPPPPPFPSQRRYTEQQLDEAVEKVKQHYKSLTPDYLAWKQVEKYIDDIVNMRNSKLRKH